MLNTKLWTRTAVIVTLPVLVAATACGGGAQNGTGSGGTNKGPLYIASSNPMTGDSGYYGRDKVNAMQLAIQQANAAGGVNGANLQLIKDDDAGQPAQGASLAAKECSDSRILAVIGHWNSSVSLAAAPIYGKCGLPNINDDTTVKLSGISPYEFRVFATGAVEGRVLAKYAHAKGYNKVAVVYDTNDYGITLNQAFAAEFKKLGGTVPLQDSYIEGDKNFAPDAGKVQSSGADAVFIAGYYTETALIAKAIRSVPLSIPILGGDGIDAPQLVQLGGTAVNGVVFADDYSSELKSATNQKFVKQWEAKYKTAPDTFAALAYDATNLVIAAMRSGATTRAGIQKWLASEHGFNGVTGPIQFDAKHDAARNVYLLTVAKGKIALDPEQLKNGQLVPAATILK